MLSTIAIAPNCNVYMCYWFDVLCTYCTFLCDMDLLCHNWNCPLHLSSTSHLSPVLPSRDSTQHDYDGDVDDDDDAGDYAYDL